MAIPSDEASCVAWHEAYNEPGADGTNVTRFAGVGGKPWGTDHGVSGAYPTVQTLASGAYSGRRVYRFDDTDDRLLTAATLSARPFTIVAAFASNSTGTGKRTLCNGTGGDNWLLGARGEAGGDYAVYNNVFLDSGVPADTAVHIHTIRQRVSPAPIGDYRIDSVQKATGGGSGVPGPLWVGGSGFYAGETANADLLGIAVFNEYLSDAAVAAQETYWSTGGGGVTTTLVGRLSQLAIEAVRDGTPNARLSQHVIESVQGANPNLRMSQQVIEVVNGASPNVRMSQLIIEVVHARRRGYNWAQLVG